MMMVVSTVVLAGLLAQARPATPPAAGQDKKVPAAEQTKTATPSDGLTLQVALDRAGFSPGVIDGQAGSSTKKALEAYRKQNGGDPPTSEEPTTRYRITEEDTTGPFEANIPAELPDQAKLPALSYKSVDEALAERFHTTQQFLRKLNPAAKFTAGEEIVVPNVEPLQVPTGTTDASKPARGSKPAANEKPAPGAKPTQGATPEPPRGTSGQRGQQATGQPDVVVTVSKSSSALTVTDPGGKVLMYAPVTSGSSRDPLPVGEWKVNGVTINPPFRYNPDLFWDADPSHTKALIKPGPNNPVGVVWIDLSKEHYGIHGSPEPQTIGRTQSHGCVRLTNWDALKLAGFVKAGTRVVFTE